MPRTKSTTEADEPLSRQSLKAAVWYTVTKIAQEEELSLPFAASEHFVATLAEVVFQQALSLGKDLERFANHAGRLTINVDDVKLAARRNEPLYETLTTAAIQRGLTLADLKADSKTGAKTKQVKAPRLAADKSVTGESCNVDKALAKDKGKGKAVVKSSKAKGEEKVVATAEDGSEDEDAGGCAGPSGGFVKASALSKGKGKKRAIVPDDEDEEMEEGGDGERSEDDRRRKGKGMGRKR
ncbi:centromere protein S [Rhodotorula toruloides]|uniref:Centromere protein S n=1 Tax=Rhodotorula toruloides TaxID=5286 RepID=A0A511K8S8_RHOTO|nr:centromere protein S [Rhodotorula toruloides]